MANRVPAKTVMIIHKIIDELERADKKHPPMAERVEGLYTLRCEVMELAREVHRKNTDEEAIEKEAIQVAAMAIKFIRDCCVPTCSSPTKK